MLVEFERSEYIITEIEAAVEVCVIVNGVIDITVAIDLTLTAGGTASPTDFTFIPATLTFTPISGTSLCHSVAVAVDSIIEDDETFLLAISTEMNIPGVVLSPINAVVTIEDSTQTNVTLVDSIINLDEGESGSLCFSADLERDLTIEIDIDSAGGMYKYIVWDEFFQSHLMFISL